jgi:TonB-linked SusC/RagA family outer membrane protein
MIQFIEKITCSMEPKKCLRVVKASIILMFIGIGVVFAGNPGQTITTITGKVTDEKGEPLPGVSIVEKNTFNGAVTDVDGNYSINPKNPNPVLIFSYIGYEPVQKTVGNQKVINVVLMLKLSELEDVVVTGIFERKKEGFTGSATTVNSEQIRRLTSGNILKALEIVDPGFKIYSSNLSGANPNAIPDYQLRGNASIGNYESDDVSVMRGDYNSRTNQPLFVLDGVIGVSSTTITDLDPEQIESITLLKDAAATVIYGSEAANGVVVVETKKPKPGKLIVTYNGNYGITWPDLSVYNLTNAAEKLEVEKLAGYPNAINQDLTAVKMYYNEIEKEVLRGVNTDWLSIPVRSVVTNRHGLNFEGGDQSLRYKVYLGVNFSPGVMKETNLNGQNGRVDIHYRFNKFQIVNQTYLDYSYGSRESSYGYFQQYGLMNPYYTPYDKNGNVKKILDPQSYYIGEYSNPTYNPLYNTLYEMKNEQTNLQIRESVRLEYRPVTELKLDMDFNLTKGKGTAEVFKPAHHTDFANVVLPENKGSYSYQNSDNNSLRLSLTAAYNKVFNNAHTVSLFGRYTIGQSDSYNSSLVMTGYPNDKLSEIFMGTTFQSVNGSESISRSIGYVFTGNYSYKQRYAADFSMRMDASSQFGKNNRYAPFWSTGAKWNAHNEKFIKKFRFIDELIIRGSIGTTGSQDFNSYQALQTYDYRNTMSVYTSSDVVGAVLLALGNPDLKWQQTINQNLALDFSVFDGFFGARFELYSKLTKNTLLDYTLAPSIGFSNVKENLGEISNKGYEFSVRLMPYKDRARRAYWNVTFTGANNKSTIEKISEAMKSRNDQIYSDYGRDLSKPLPQYVNGMSQTAIWGVKSIGIDPQSGEEILLTRGGEFTTEWAAKDRVVIGDKRPILSGKVTSTFAYKDFSLTVGGGYTFGGDTYNSTLADRVENANLRLNVDKRVLTERWKNQGDIARYKIIDGSENRQKTKATSRFVMRNDEVRLSTINATYRMGASDFPLIKRLGLSYITYGLYWDDILRFSTIKMERGINYPFARTVSLSLNLTF